MGVNLNLDYSTLFSSLSSTGGLSSGSGGISGNYLSDYASIKNGSYGRLLKSYYEKNGDKSTSNPLVGKDDSKNLTAIKSDANSLVESADKLLTKGSKSIFKEDNHNEIYKNLKAFTEDYNSMLDSAGDSNVNGILRSASNMTTMTKTYSSMLSKVGIEIGKNNKLSIDEETLKTADLNTLKSLFNGANSFAYNVSTKASMMGHTANSEAQKRNTYSAGGNFNFNNSSGNLFDSYL